MFLVLISLTVLQIAISIEKVIVFGASGGTGQQICNILAGPNTLMSKPSYEIFATSRNIEKLSQYPLLSKCKYVYSDARKLSSLLPVLKNMDHVVISIGTTAFPTSKWEKGDSNPRIACYETVENILKAIKISSKRPKKVILLSSIGVERTEQFPFKLLNAYKVLDEKRNAERLLLKSAKEMKFFGIICRPGRLVGAPFTNFDLAKLLQLDQGQNKAIVVSKTDTLNGDVERKDVAKSIYKLIESKKLEANQIVYSIVNTAGSAPSDDEWNQRLKSITSK